MNADAFDRLVRLSARRGTRRAVLAALAALPLVRARAASAQICAPVGGLCTASYGCCDGTPCPMNLNAWVGICLGASPTSAPTSTTVAQGTGTNKDGVRGGQRRVPDDGNALGNRAKMHKRRRSRRDRKQKRRKKR